MAEKSVSVRYLKSWLLPKIVEAENVIARLPCDKWSRGEYRYALRKLHEVKQTIEELARLGAWIESFPHPTENPISGTSGKSSKNLPPWRAKRA